jgi:hypothetical protein
MKHFCGRFIPLIAVPLLLAAGPHRVQAVSDSWQVASGDWSVPGDLSSGAVPAATTTAYAANGGTVGVTSQDVCEDLYVGDPNSANTGTVQMSGGQLVDGTLIIDSPSSLTDGSSLTVGQGASAIFSPAAAAFSGAAAVSAVPEPGTVWLLIAGLSSASVCRKGRARRTA